MRVANNRAQHIRALLMNELSDLDRIGLKSSDRKEDARMRQIDW